MSTAHLLAPAAFPPVASGLPLAPTPPHERFEPSAVPSPTSDDNAAGPESAPTAPSAPPSPPDTASKPARTRGSAGDGDSWAPRPPNAWILYRSDKSQELKRRKASSPELVAMSSRQRQAEMSREISVLWKHESKSVKDHYARRAEKERADHRQRYPNYKYRPKRRAADASRSMYALRRHSSFDPLQLSFGHDHRASSGPGLADSRTSFASYTSATTPYLPADQTAVLQYARRSAQAEPYYIPSTSVGPAHAPSTSLPAAPAPGPASTVQLHRSSAPPSAQAFPVMPPTYSPTYSPAYSTTDISRAAAHVSVPATTDLGGNPLARPQSQPGLSSAPFALAPPHSPEFDVGCPPSLPLMGSGSVPMEASLSSDSSISDLPAYTTTSSSKYDQPSPFALFGGGASTQPTDSPATTMPLCPPQQLDAPLSFLGPDWLEKPEPQPSFRPATAASCAGGFTTHAPPELAAALKWEEHSPLSLHDTLPCNHGSTFPIFPAGLVAFSDPASGPPATAGMSAAEHDGPPFASSTPNTSSLLFPPLVTAHPTI